MQNVWKVSRNSRDQENQNASPCKIPVAQRRNVRIHTQSETPANPNDKYRNREILLGKEKKNENIMTISEEKELDFEK